MNKRELSNFAVWAKNNLEKQIGVSLNILGIYSASNIKNAYIKGDITIIDGSDKTYDKSFKYKRDRIVELIKNDGYEQTIEQLAYTWFNRLVALRFMEVHGYLDHGFKIFPTTTSIEPEILSNYKYLVDDLKLDIDYCNKLKQSDNIEELYRYILFKQCNELSKSLPMLFAHQYDYLELLLPTTLLKGQTIITELVKLDENDFKEDVEVIGWLYQFYISAKKDEVFASKKTITKDTLPAVTQLFTPDWIVRYMVENSVGRIWLESYPSSSLKEKFKYYVDDAEQTEEVNKQLEEIKYKNVNPEDIKIVEPCCGSGHILVYCFDLLEKMYEEKGYNKRDIPGLILKKNLVGFDVDKRAAQLASFALMMKARSIDPKFLNDDRRVSPKVFEIKDSQSLKRIDWKRKINELNLSDWKNNPITTDELKILDYIVKTFEDGKVIGSLLKVKRSDQYIPLRKKIIELKKLTITPIIEPEFIEYGIDRLIELLALAYYLSFKFDVMITNPPYIGISSLEPACKKYAVDNYPNSKTDMFAMFMETDFAKRNGFTAMINMHSWMFLKSYEEMRKSFISEKFIVNMIHLGSRAFAEIAGEVVQTTTFVFRDHKMNLWESVFCRLVDSPNKEEIFLQNAAEISYIATNEVFKTLPGYIFGYWVSERILNIFATSTPLIDMAKPAQGMATGDNNKFVRMWWEVNYTEEKLVSSSREESIQANAKWVPYNKGGSFRRWYGNNECVVYFKNFGADIAASSGSVIRNSQQYLLQSITWGKIATGPISFRYKPFGHVFDVAGTSIFGDYTTLIYLLGLLNTTVIQYILEIMAPTMNYEVGQIANLPIIVDESKREIVNSLVTENVFLSKQDWDINEQSWDFKKHPFLNSNSLINGSDFQNNRILLARTKMKENEENLNILFREVYMLNNEVDVTVDESRITLTNISLERDIKSFISYLIGVLMGRYSLKEEGVIFAGGIFDKSRYGTYEVDDDGIIPLYSKLGMEDNLTNKIITLIKQIYGEENYKENIDFIADALGKKVNESSEETLNRYLCNDFYNDHLKIYQKRPIYWMFSSGKNNGFKCLIYLHRYNEDTLAKINSKYLLPETTRLKNELNDISNALTRASDQEKRSLLKLEATINDQYNEAIEYSLVMDHMANRYIKLNLDDGVKVNYAKFQGIELVKDDGAKIKKDLLVPIK